MPRLDDGFATIISFANYPSIKLYEHEVSPYGLSAGGAIDVTNMRNTRYITKKPKKLLNVDDSELNVSYDPVVYEDLEDAIGENQLITQEFSDGSSISVWGWIDSFKPDRAVNGQQPKAKVVLIASNLNDSDVETGPAYDDGVP